MQLVTASASNALSREANRLVLVSRLWRLMRQEWERSQERAVAHSILNLDHNGVSEDYLQARGRR